MKVHTAGGRQTRKAASGWGIFTVLSFGATAVFLLTAFSACMIVPFDQQTVGTRSDPVVFAGGVFTPNAEVVIEALDPQGNDWETIGRATSVDYPSDIEGTEMYYWTTTVTIANKYWVQDCASKGFHASVRSRIGGAYLASVEEDAEECYDRVGAANFLSECTAPESPAARVYTANYRDFGQECANVINDLRAREGLPALTRYKEKECDADEDARINYESGPHTSMSGQAQNECSTRDTINDILNNCIRQSMYNDEKSCYQQYGDDCYYGTETPCICGHYINMTGKNYTYTKVACGLYIINGRYHSVQNYYR